MKEDLSSKEVCCNDVNNLSPKKKQKLNKLNEKYKSHETFIIAREARKTLRFVEKNTTNFPNKYLVLKNKIISTCYNILEWIYRANIFQDKKEIIVQKFLFGRSLKKGHFI